VSTKFINNQKCPKRVIRKKKKKRIWQKIDRCLISLQSENICKTDVMGFKMWDFSELFVKLLTSGNKQLMQRESKVLNTRVQKKM